MSRINKLMTVATAMALMALSLYSEFASADTATRKILCLHGGGGRGSDFEQAPGMQALMQEMESQGYEFYFPNAPYNGLWVRDPPGGKGNPTTNPNFASRSVRYLNRYVERNGPFYGILGYSQGSMFTPYYLSVVPDRLNTFQMAMMFAGYLPETHQGLLSTITERAPFSDIRALVYMGENDDVISNTLTQAQAGIFSSPTVVVDPNGAHYLPTREQAFGYNSVIQFMEDNNGTDAVTSPPSTPESESSTFAPTPLDNKEDQSENKEGGNNSKSGGSKKQEGKESKGKGSKGNEGKGKGKKGKGGIKKGKGWKEADEKQQTIKDPWNKNETETDETNSKNNLNGYDESTEGKDQTKGNGVTEKEDYGKYEYVEKDTYQNKWWWG